MTAPSGLSRGQLAGLSLPSLAFAGYDVARKSYLPLFLNRDFGLDLGVVAWIVLALGCLSIALEAGFGLICDRTPVSWGLRRFWLTVGTGLLLAAGSVTLMGVAWGNPALMLAGFACVIAAWIVCNVTHGGWALEVSRGAMERARVFGNRALAGLAGITVFTAFAALVEGGTLPFTRIPLIALLTASVILATVTHALLLWQLPDPDRSRGHAERSSLLAPVRLLVADREGWRLAALFAVVGGHAGVIGAGILFVVEFGLGLPGWGSTVLSVESASCAAGILMTTAFAVGRFAPLQILRWVFLANCLTAVALLAMPPQQPAAVLTWSAIAGLVAGVDFMVLRIELGRNLDKAAKPTPQPGPGASLRYAAFHLPFNICAALSAAALLTAFRLAGIVAGASQATAQPSYKLISIFVASALIPGIFGLLVLREKTQETEN
ncbi:MAG: MFS transporter [Sphingomonadales bacterium]|nr:MFS transporter [Sphingomonadales bacterium]MDE2569779.1 MFS transporter [Sphingomonadales bacterium]